MHVTLGGPEGMLLTKSNSAERVGLPTFKGGVDASRAHGCHVIHVYHAFEFKVPCLRACDYPSMAPVVGQGLPVPKVPPKKSTNGQKNCQSINQDQLGKVKKKGKKN